MINSDEQLKGLGCPQLVLNIWFGSFASVFFGVYWVFLVTEFLKALSISDIASTVAFYVGFIIVLIFFIYFSWYQHLLVNYAIHVDKRLRYALYCAIAVAVMFAVTYLIVVLLKSILLVVSETQVDTSLQSRFLSKGLDYVYLLVLAWSAVGFIAMWYYCVFPEFEGRRLRRLDIERIEF